MQNIITNKNSFLIGSDKPIFYTALLKIFFIWNLCLPFLVMVRLCGSSGVGQFPKFIMPLFVFLVFLSMLRTKRLKLDLFSYMILFFAFYGLLRYIILIDSFPFRKFISPFFTYIMILLTYSFFSFSEIDPIYLKNKLYIFCKRLIFVYFLFILFSYFLYKLGVIHYLGFAINTLMICLAYSLVRRKTHLTLLIFVLMLLTGKRGVIIFAPLIIILFNLMMNKNLLKGIFISSFNIIFSILFIIFFITIIGQSYFQGLLNKWGELSAFFSMNASHHSLSVASSGRTNELIAALHFLNENIYRWIFGSGFTVLLHVKNINYTLVESYVHISPVNIILCFGLVGAVLFSLVYFRLLIKMYKRAVFLFRSENDTFAIFLFLSHVGLLFSSFTSYFISSDFTFWVVLGLANYYLLYHKKI